MRTRLIAGNWKMHTNFIEGLVLANNVTAESHLWASGKIEVLLCTPFIHLQTIGNMLKEYPNTRLGAQNMHFAEKGAFTGEISATMLKSVGCEYVLIGHSERRTLFGETNEMLAKKVRAALAQGLKPILCIGEPLEVRQINEQEAYIQDQLQAVLPGLTDEEWSQITLAYEPIWAIGTGLTASPEQAQDMHAFIRAWLTQHAGETLANQIRILYGGSCNASNAQSLFAQADVDGGLIGGASLKAEDFLAIIRHAL